jgi:FKBP-type peptidyl-prolyl cis-trans isomerase
MKLFSLKSSLVTAIVLSITIASCSSEPSTTTPEQAVSAPVALDTTLENGLSIKDTQLGSGIPADSGHYFIAHYIGYLENDEIFDSSYERNTPINFQLGKGQVIQAFEHGLKGMREGGKRTLIAPASLAYGDQGIAGIIPANSNLRFEVEMLRVIVPPQPWDISNSRIQTTDSGIEYVIVESGNGEQPLPQQMVSVHYAGYLDNGQLFDSSHLRSDPFRFTVGTGEVIPGWEEIIRQMRVGEKRTIMIPPNLAYGETGIEGTIPANAKLRFDIELLEVVTSN